MHSANQMFASFDFNALLLLSFQSLFLQPVSNLGLQHTSSKHHFRFFFFLRLVHRECKKQNKKSLKGERR